jgi:hypothetical protein
MHVVIGGVASTAHTGDEADVLSIQTIKAIIHPQTGKDAQGKNKEGATNANFAIKPPAKSKEPMANKEISQLELANETGQTDNSYADDTISQTDNNSQVDEDSEDTGKEALAGLRAASDNESSKVEKVPKIIKEPKKKQPTQTVRDWIQASRKEPFIKGF